MEFSKDKLIQFLYEYNIIKIGKFTLKSGIISRYYFNIKEIISEPNLLKYVIDYISFYTNEHSFNKICGIPLGGLPIATGLSLKSNKPLIFVRYEKKKYGLREQIEGKYNINDKVLVIDDVLTSGKSIMESYEILNRKMNIEDYVVIIDRMKYSSTFYKFIEEHNLRENIRSLINMNDIIKYRINDIKNKKKSKLCFSADLQNPIRILEILEKIGEYIVICKIHLDTIYFSKDMPEYDFISKLIELSNRYNFLLMEDRKLSDISSIVDKQYRRLQQYGDWIDIITIQASVNDIVIKNNNIFGIMLVANMSNNSIDNTEKAIRLCRENPEKVIGYITQKRLEGGINMTPGISLSNKSEKDQNYRGLDIDTDIIIVGRGIYEGKMEELEERVKNYLNF
jgi:uridine monophosphate synthetase